MLSFSIDDLETTPINVVRGHKSFMISFLLDVISVSNWKDSLLGAIVMLILFSSTIPSIVIIVVTLNISPSSTEFEVLQIEVSYFMRGVQIFQESWQA